MNKKQILSMFLEEGVLIPPDLLEKVDEENYEEVLKSLKGEKKTGDEARTPTKAEKKRNEASVKDFLDYYSRKYEFLKGVLLKKMEAVSINKGKKIFSKTSIIGRVKEKTASGFIIEDVTGEAEVATESKGILPGDVIGLKGWFKEGGFLADEVVWPDIPLTNTARVPKFLLARRLTEGIRERSERGVVINLGSEGKETPNPDHITVMHRNEKISVLVFKPEKAIGNEGVAWFLKRRELPHRGGMEIYTSHLIEKIPNILWLAENKENWTKNYKGIIIVSTDHKSLFEYTEEDGGKFEEI